MELPITREQLIKEIGAEDFPKSAQDELVNRITRAIFKHLLTRILASMPDAEAEEFKRLMEAKKGPETEALARKYIPDLTGFIAQETRSALDEYHRS